MAGRSKKKPLSRRQGLARYLRELEVVVPIYCEVAVVYLLFCTVITKLQSLLERQLNARGFQ